MLFLLLLLLLKTFCQYLLSFYVSGGMCVSVYDGLAVWEKNVCVCVCVCVYVGSWMVGHSPWTLLY